MNLENIFKDKTELYEINLTHLLEYFLFKFKINRDLFDLMSNVSKDFLSFQKDSPFSIEMPDLTNVEYDTVVSIKIIKENMDETKKSYLLLSVNKSKNKINGLSLRLNQDLYVNNRLYIAAIDKEFNVFIDESIFKSSYAKTKFLSFRFYNSYDSMNGINLPEPSTGFVGTVENTQYSQHITNKMKEKVPVLIEDVELLRLNSDNFVDPIYNKLTEIYNKEHFSDINSFFNLINNYNKKSQINIKKEPKI